MVRLATEMDRGGSPLAEVGKSRVHAERLLLSLFTECLAEAIPETSELLEDISLLQVRFGGPRNESKQT
ncbi:MAG: hypothetical protein AAAB35_14275 [Phyllobacterium sp.]|uniref:hypothetical protein n=1 Tax=Phyllobacterium sp. TaxID=1871046 RepID=UPI0030F11459